MPSITSFFLFSLAFVGAVHAEDCTTEQLLNVTSDSNTAACTSETGLSITSLSSLTTDDIYSICNSTACMALLDDVSSLGLGDCTLPSTNVSVQTDILDVVATVCSGNNSTTTSSSSGTSVGDDSDDSSTSSNNVEGGSSSTSSSGASTVVTSCISAIVMVLATALP